MNRHSPRRIGTLALVLLFLLGTFAILPPSAVAAADDYKVVDATGDPAPLLAPGILPVGLPENPATNPVDLKEFRITNEDEVGLAFEIQAVDFTGLGNPVSQLGGNEAFFVVEFELQGTEISYELQFRPVFPAVTATAPTGKQPVSASFCIAGGDGDGGGRGGGGDCYDQHVWALIDWDNNVLSAYVTKNALLGREAVSATQAPPRGLPSTLLKGQQLTKFTIQSHGQFPAFFTDEMPDSGDLPNYAFKTDAANAKVRLGLAGLNVPAVPSGGPGGFQFGGGSNFGTTPGTVSVTPGVPTLVPLKIENTNAGKRIVNLSAKLDDGSDADRWELQVVPTVTVPGGDARVVNLIVSATGSVKHRDMSRITVYGRSLGFASELAAVKLTLIGSVPPSPERPVLHFHGKVIDDGLEAAGLCPIKFFCGDKELWMNTLDNDPSSTLGNGIELEPRIDPTGGNPEAAFRARFELDTNLARDIVLDINRPIEVALALNPTVAFSGSVRVSLGAGQKLVGSTTVTGDISPGGIVVAKFLPLTDAQRVTVADGALDFELDVSAPLTGAGAATPITGLTLVAKNSKITMPIIPDPNAVNNALPLGPAFITIAALTDLQEFLNPGRTKIFNATVTNEGVQTDEVHLTVMLDKADWSVRIAPGSRFKLEPGESVKVGFLLRSPVTAKEGDIATMLINATSSVDAKHISQVRFQATITTAFDIPDESTFLVDEDTGKKLVSSNPKGSPGVGVALALAGLVAVAVEAGRRRKR